MLKFCDLNHTLVEKVKALGIEAICNDYFVEAYRTPKAVLMTASNPMWTFGGGIDYAFYKNFPELVKYKQVVGGEMERRMNICFCITVDEHLKATKEKVKEAIQFALSQTLPEETLLIHGAGTGIGANQNFTEDTFVEIMRELCHEKTINTQ